MCRSCLSDPFSDTSHIENSFEEKHPSHLAIPSNRSSVTLKPTNNTTVPVSALPVSDAWGSFSDQSDPFGSVPGVPVIAASSNLSTKGVAIVATVAPKAQVPVGKTVTPPVVLTPAKPATLAPGLATKPPAAPVVVWGGSAAGAGMQMCNIMFV